jgi:hypothetical protein
VWVPPPARPDHSRPSVVKGPAVKILCVMFLWGGVAGVGRRWAGRRRAGGVRLVGGCRRAGAGGQWAVGAVAVGGAAPAGGPAPVGQAGAVSLGESAEAAAALAARRRPALLQPKKR